MVAEKVAERLLEEFESGKYQRCVIAGEVLLGVILDSAHKEPRYAQLLPSRKSVDELGVLLSKFEFARMADELKLPFPKFEICDNHLALSQAAERIGYPVVVKSESGYAGCNVRVVKNPADLESAWKELGADGKLLVQSFIDGEIGSSAVLMEHGKLRAWASFVHPLRWPNPTSPSVNVKFLNPPEMEGILKAIGERTGFDGICGVDWMLDKETGKAVVLEFNPRPTATHVMGSRVGASFHFAMRVMNEGHEVYLRPCDPVTPKPVALFPQAVYCAISARRPSLLFAALRSAPWRDPGVLMAIIRRICTHFLLPTGLRDTMRARRNARTMKALELASR